MEQCPCGLDNQYDACCGAIHNGERKPDSPEQLMRARYSAFVKGKTPFILDTVHPEKRSEHDEKSIKEWSERSTWHGLDIVETSEAVGSDTGKVEFIAHFSEKGKRYKHHELATFKKEEDGWFFFDGEIVKAKQFKRETPKVGRNEPCPCGSGNKYKKCCGK